MTKFKIGNLVIRNNNRPIASSESSWNMGNKSYKVEYISKQGLLVLEDYPYLVEPYLVILKPKPISGYVVNGILFLDESKAWDYKNNLDPNGNEHNLYKMEVDYDSLIQYVKVNNLFSIKENS